MAKKRGLGKGLDMLFLDNSAQTKGEVQTVSISEIEPNKDQPRKEFDQEALIELADSIRTHGVIQPLLVRPLGQGSYQIVAGERRWRASRMAGLTELPVVVREMSQEEVMQIALVENLQREDLNPIEEALGYEVLMEQYSLTQDQVAKAVGKARSGIANALRLLRLPKQVKEMVQRNELSQGHAKVLLALEDEKNILELANACVKKQLSVRQLEKMVKEQGKEPVNKQGKTSYLKEVELALTEQLGTKVKLAGTENSGKIQLSYYSKEELQKMIEILS